MADINVTMVGGRRAGKTSIMAAMDDCCQEVLKDIDDISVTCVDGGMILNDKIVEMESYFLEPYISAMTFHPDDTPGKDAKTFEYEVEVGERQSGYTLRFTDVPGEHYANSAYFEETQERLRKSHVIIVAIDTPHMMENMDRALGYGKYHKEFNRITELKRLFSEMFKENQDPRMVLFVPLKCEKYYYQGRMKEVADTVKTAYGEILDNTLMAGDIKKMCTVAIMPCLTLGGAEFFRFDGEPNKEVGIYNYYVTDLALRTYKPKNCEQPLFMTLLYLIALAERTKQGRWTAFNWLRETLFKEARMKDLEACKDTLAKRICKDENAGFKLLQDPLGMGI